MVEATVQQTKGTQGLAIILTNSYVDKKRLKGTKRDFYLWLTALGHRLNFDCESACDLSKDETMEFMMHCGDKQMDSDSKFVIFVFSGHGSASGIISQDEKEILYKDLLNPIFRGSYVPKHKLIFLDACREADAKSIREESLPPSPKNYFLFYPCLYNEETDDSQQGSLFSRAVTKRIVEKVSITSMANNVKKDLPRRDADDSTAIYTNALSFPESEEDWSKLQRSPAAGQPTKGELQRPPAAGQPKKGGQIKSISDLLPFLTLMIPHLELLGPALGNPDHAIGVIAGSGLNLGKCQSILQNWLHCTPAATWDLLCEKLISSKVPALASLAAEIQKAQQ